MIGIELKSPCAPIRKKLLDEYKMLTGNASNPNTLRILPALNISKTEIDEFVTAFEALTAVNV